MKVLLVGYYGFGNFGDDLLMIAGERIVRQKFANAEIVIFANYTSNLQSFFQREGYRHYIHRLLKKSCQLIDWTIYEQFDLVIHCGGGVFFDHSEGSGRDWILNRVVYCLGVERYSKLTSAIRRVIKRPARISTTRRIGIGLSVGPYSSSGPRLKREASIIGSFDRLAVRDPASLERVQQLGLHKGVELFADLVFESENWMPEFSRQEQDCGTVGIILCNGKVGNDTIINAKDGDALLPSLNYIYIFLDENHDRTLIEKAIAKGLKVVVWRPNITPLASFISEVSSCVLLITNRAHGAIVGACLNIPSICINTDNKLESIHGMIPNGSLLLDCNFTVKDLAYQVGYMLKRIDEYKILLRSDVALNKERVKKMIEFAFNYD